MANLDYIMRVPEPVLSNEELSSIVGNLAQRIEALHADILVLEKNQLVVMAKPKRPSLIKRFKRWLRSLLDE